MLKFFVIQKSNFSNEDITNYSTDLIWQGFPLWNNVTDLKVMAILPANDNFVTQSHVLTPKWWEVKRICVGFTSDPYEFAFWASILVPLINEILFDQLSENMYCTWHISTDNVRETFTTKLADAFYSFTWT